MSLQRVTDVFLVRGQGDTLFSSLIRVWCHHLCYAMTQAQGQSIQRTYTGENIAWESSTAKWR
jgi:hypothetical protein